MILLEPNQMGVRAELMEGEKGGTEREGEREKHMKKKEESHREKVRKRGIEILGRRRQRREEAQAESWHLGD